MPDDPTPAPKVDDPAVRSEGYVDLPFESGSADPQPLEYADLGPQHKYVEGEPFDDAQQRYEDAAGGDAGPDDKPGQPDPTPEEKP